MTSKPPLGSMATQSVYVQVTEDGIVREGDGWTWHGERPTMLEGACHCGTVRWRIDFDPELVTACNCTLCRRYGVIWAFGHDGVDVHVTGPTRAYTPASEMDFCFCETCGNMIYSRGRRPSENGKVRAAVNLRLTDPDAVADIPLEHQDCLVTYEEILPRGRVKEVWF